MQGYNERTMSDNSYQAATHQFENAATHVKLQKLEFLIAVNYKLFLKLILDICNLLVNLV